MTQTRNDAGVLETIREVVDNAAAGTVFGTPITQDGVIVLPVARVRGGGGGGGGNNPAADGPEAAGFGGGLGLSAKPLGVFVIRDGGVTWRPAIDVNKVIIGAQIVAVVALFVARALARRRGRSHVPD